jgi:hypothetical protein
MVRVKVGESTVFVPAIQAILRSQVALAAKGIGPAQRAVIEKIQAIEQELALEAAAEAAETKATEKPLPDRELARRIAWILSGEVPKRSRRQVQPVDHLDHKPREMPLGKPFIEPRRKQKPCRAVKPPEIAHQAHPAGESFAPSYPLRLLIR